MNSDSNPIDLLFGGMEKLGPGHDADTLHVLHQLPRQDAEVIVDAGCGTGRQTLVLAQALGRCIDAVDTYEPFLYDLTRRARAAGLERLVRVHRMDMRDISNVFERIDLLWSEGAAYSIGFAHALNLWASVIPWGGFAVVSELSWLREKAPPAVREFFVTGYPEMRSVRDNLAVVANAGYQLLGTHTLAPQAWVNGYYDVLEPRAQELLVHPDAAVREFAEATVKEIEVFNASDESFGYVFYILQRL